MRTLHFGLRVRDLGRALVFYTALGYEVVGSVPETPLGHLTMLRLPGDEFVTIELVHAPADGEFEHGAGLSHFVVGVESLDATVTSLAAQGIEADLSGSPDDPDDPDGLRTAMITDPDGNRIELVQWPAGHPDGFTAADFQN